MGDGGNILYYSGESIPPTVTTNAATGVTSNSATLNMSYTIGSYSSVDVRFAYKKFADADWTHSSWAGKSEDGDHAETITGLDSDTPMISRLNLNTTPP